MFWFGGSHHFEGEDGEHGINSVKHSQRPDSPKFVQNAVKIVWVLCHLYYALRFNLQGVHDEAFIIFIILCASLSRAPFHPYFLCGKVEICGKCYSAEIVTVSLWVDG